MSIVRVEKNTYTVDPLYQWDLNQVLQVHGLSLATIPEIHFTNAAMDKAIVRQASMDSAGVISADIPNSLLQKQYTITAYVCIYEGSTFRSLYKIDIPVKQRQKPGDYTLEDDPEVYSFNALENKVDNVLRLAAETDVKYNKAIADLQTATVKYNEATKALDKVEEAEELINTTYKKDEVLADTTKSLFGLSSAGVPNELFIKINEMLFTKAVIETGEYEGTDTASTSSSSAVHTHAVINFTGYPHIVFIVPHDKDTGEVVSSGAKLLVRDATQEYKLDASASDGLGTYPAMTWGDRSVSTSRCNYYKNKYKYIALCTVTGGDLFS